MSRLFRRLERPLPPFPTDAVPGSAAKVAVMAERYARGYHLHHPRDARMDQPGRVRVPVFGRLGDCADTGDTGDDPGEPTSPNGSRLVIVDWTTAADDADARREFPGPDYHAGRGRVGDEPGGDGVAEYRADPAAGGEGLESEEDWDDA